MKRKTGSSRSGEPLGDRGEPDKLETKRDIDLAMHRERLFDHRSKRRTREERERFTLLERKVGLAVAVVGALVAMFVFVSYPLAVTLLAGGLGLGGGVRAVWRRLVDRRDRHDGDLADSGADRSADG